MRVGEREQQGLVQRLQEAHVHMGGADVFFLQLVKRLGHVVANGTDGDQRDLFALAQQLSFADGDIFRLVVPIGEHASSARVADGER